MIRLADTGVVGLSMSDPADGLVVDSACSATQLASGQPALAEVVGLDANGELVLDYVNADYKVSLPADELLSASRRAGP